MHLYLSPLRIVLLPVLLSGLTAGCGRTDSAAASLCQAIQAKDPVRATLAMTAVPAEWLKNAGACLPAREAFAASADPAVRDIALAMLERGLDANAVVLMQGRPDWLTRSSERGLVELAAGSPDATLIQALLSRGLNTRRRQAGLAVFWAAMNGHMEVVRTLVEAGANVNEAAGGSTALGQAVKHRRHAMVEYLDGRGARESVAEQGAVFLAARTGNVGVLRTALAGGAARDALDVEGQTALVRATGFGRIDAMRLLIEAKAPLDQFVDGGDAALHVAVREANLDAIGLLLQAGAKVDGRFDEHSPTPLALALRAGALPVVSRLLEAGADANRIDAGGDTALRLAVQNKDLALVQLLLRAKADVNLKPQAGWPILHLAITGCQSADFDVPLLRLLLDAGAERGARDHTGITALENAEQSAAAASSAFNKTCHEARAQVLRAG